MNSLAVAVETELMPVLTPLGFTVREVVVSDSFDNAYVVAERPDLRLRILRERSVLGLDVAPTCAPEEWTDAGVVMDYLGLSDDAGFPDRGLFSGLPAIGRFLAATLPELRATFDAGRWGVTRLELEALKTRRADRLFG